MTRKDTILIAVVINAGLLAALFTTAVIYDTDGGGEIEIGTPLAENKVPSSELPSRLVAVASTGDEVDNVLKYYTSPVHSPILTQNQPEMYIPEAIPMALQSNPTEDEDQPEAETTSVKEQMIEVTVKRGDMLEKIARAHKTNVEAIKRANHLESEHLSIGQVLKIPVKQASPAYTSGAMMPSSNSKVETKQEVKKESKAVEPVYYVIKSGDNPWKIAKQFGVKYDEILRLNNMDEEKARNLKIGDRIRIK